MPYFLPIRSAAFLRRAALGLALALPLGAWAAPKTDTGPVDPVSHFLADRGLIDTPSLKDSTLVQKVRDGASDLVMSAMNFLGVPYRRGGNTAEEGFDCSGFTRYVFDHSMGLVLPRKADEQARAPGLLPVKRDELKPGDLVFFNTLRHTFSHVGIYIGEGKFIHAPKTGSEVRIEDIHESYWASRFTGARRALGLDAGHLQLPDTSTAVPGTTASVGANGPAATLTGGEQTTPSLGMGPEPKTAHAD